MQQFNFLKYKYGRELLIDCVELDEIANLSVLLKEVHSTTFYEIFFITGGTGSVVIEGRRYDFKGPVILMLPPSLPRKWDIDYSPDSMVVFFEGEFIETFLKDPLFLNRLHYFGNSDNGPVLLLNDSGMPYFIALLQKISKEIKNSAPDSPHLLRAYLYELLIILNRTYAGYYGLNDALYKNNEILNFKNLLKTHIREKHTVNEYADLLKVNRNRLNQLCHQVFGKDASMIIRQELLLACKNELLGSSKTITEISYLYSFSAPSNFNRFFRMMTGITPAAYRESYAI